jgi:hypothetical protein
MIKFYLNKLIPQKIGNRIAMLYENWIIPPQNETLIEIKRKEFKEKTKYLDPKVLYTLTDEEKTDLRNQGYFVDLNEKTWKEIKNFKLTYNRHADKYNINNFYYNFAIYNTKYYYVDQNYANYFGDPSFFNKIWRPRYRFKKIIARLIILYLFIFCYYRYNLRRHIETRKKIKKLAENNPDLVIPISSLIN